MSFDNFNEQNIEIEFEFSEVREIKRILGDLTTNDHPYYIQNDKVFVGYNQIKRVSKLFSLWAFKSTGKYYEISRRSFVRSLKMDPTDIRLRDRNELLETMKLLKESLGEIYKSIPFREIESIHMLLSQYRNLNRKGLISSIEAISSLLDVIYVRIEKEKRPKDLTGIADFGSDFSAISGGLKMGPVFADKIGMEICNPKMFDIRLLKPDQMKMILKSIRQNQTLEEYKYYEYIESRYQLPIEDLL